MTRPQRTPSARRMSGGSKISKRQPFGSLATRGRAGEPCQRFEVAPRIVVGVQVDDHPGTSFPDGWGAAGLSERSAAGMAVTGITPDRG